MTYFSKQFSAEFVLPDGTVASSVHDVDRYLKANNLAAQSDYSASYLQNVRRNNEKEQQKEIFAELIKNYKKGIWNE